MTQTILILLVVSALTAGIDMLASDTEMLKVTHDEARMLMKNRESDEAAQVIALAKERFAQKLQEIAVN